jgi:hypothetical protein
MDFVPITCSNDSYQDYRQLFKTCFPTSHKFSTDYLDWLYGQNPEGQVVGYDAKHGNQLAAHYACIPVRAQIAGKEVRVLLSLNTATHPDYQGKGLFTKLAELTYTAGAQQGFDGVYGVANANSTPGFIRKLKFQMVGSLQACVGIGPLGVDFSRMEEVAQFRRLWSRETLSWRCANPTGRIVCRQRGSSVSFRTPALRNVVYAYAELEGLTGTIIDIAKEERSISPVQLFIGMVPRAARKPSLYANIPNRLRPSPLNLIYRSLSERAPVVNPDTVFFTFLDFDAY